MPNPHLKSLLHKEMTRKEFLAFGALAAISVFGFIGVIEELLSHAATPYATNEAQNGTRGGTTSLTTATGSASTEVVEFGTGKTTTPPPTGLTLGVFVGTGPNQPGTSGANAFKTATGADIKLLHTDLPSGAGDSPNIGWGYMTSYSNLSSWLSPYAGTPYQMILDVPMVCTGAGGAAQNTLAEGANSFSTVLSGFGSSLETIWTEIAQNFVKLGFGNAILRLGWEPDGNGYYPWQYANMTEAEDYATYWKNIVNACRAVSGADFKFWYSPAGFYATGGGVTQAVAEAAFAGSAYVDAITLDLYDQYLFRSATLFPPSGSPNNSCTTAQANTVFAGYESGTYATGGSFVMGLDWLKTFSNSQGVEFGLAEWACTDRDDKYGLGDDPAFFLNSYNWSVANGLTYLIIFQGPEDGTASYLLTDGNFPNALAQYKASFGS